MKVTPGEIGEYRSKNRKGVAHGSRVFGACAWLLLMNHGLVISEGFPG